MMKTWKHRMMQLSFEQATFFLQPISKKDAFSSLFFLNRSKDFKSIIIVQIYTYFEHNTIIDFLLLDSHNNHQLSSPLHRLNQPMTEVEGFLHSSNLFALPMASGMFCCFIGSENAFIESGTMLIGSFWFVDSEPKSASTPHRTCASS